MVGRWSGPVSVRALAWFKRDVRALEQEAPEAARRRRSALEEHVGSRSTL